MKQESEAQTAALRRFVYPLFLVYLLPLSAMVAAAILSHLFEIDTSVVKIAAAMSTALMDGLRNGFGLLLIPLTTAYSVRLRKGNQGIPLETKRLLSFLIFICAISFVLHGIVLSDEPEIREYSPQIYEAFKNATLSYAKETLSYIAIVVGITSR